MNVRRVVLSSLILAALARAACVVADDNLDGAILGPAEPIGKLLVVKVGFDDEPSPLPPAPAPPLASAVISASPGRLFGPDYSIQVPPMGIPSPTNFDTREIPFHLSQAIFGLNAAGLNEEAKHVRVLLTTFQAKHQTRLQLAEKQAQLNELQAEVERLKRRVETGIAADELVISINIIEVENDEIRNDMRKLFIETSGLSNQGETVTHSALKVIDKIAFEGLMAKLRQADEVRFVGRPVMRTLSGQEASVSNGRSLPIAQVGGRPANEFGTTVTIHPTITHEHQLRCRMSAEFCVPDVANGVTLDGAFVPGLTRRKVQSTFDIKDGQTAILGGFVECLLNKQTKETFVTVTVGIVQPYDKAAGPIVFPVNDIPQPVPFLLVK